MLRMERAKKCRAVFVAKFLAKLTRLARPSMYLAVFHDAVFAST